MTALLYAIFFIPETVPYSSKAKFFSTKHLKKTVLLFTADDGTRRRWKLCVILLAFFLCSTVKVGDSIDSLFEMNSPLCWTSDIVSYFMSAEVAFISASAVVTMRLLKCCLRDIGIALTSGTMAIVHFTYMAFVQNSTMMFISKYKKHLLGSELAFMHFYLILDRVPKYSTKQSLPLYNPFKLNAEISRK